VQQPSAGPHRLGDVPHWLLFSMLVFLQAFKKKSPVSFTPLKSLKKSSIKRAEMPLTKETNSFSSRILFK
jgi:hypothetical protein